MESVLDDQGNPILEVTVGGSGAADQQQTNPSTASVAKALADAKKRQERGKGRGRGRGRGGGSESGKRPPSTVTSETVSTLTKQPPKKGVFELVQSEDDSDTETEDEEEQTAIQDARKAEAGNLKTKGNEPANEQSSPETIPRKKPRSRAGANFGYFEIEDPVGRVIVRNPATQVDEDRTLVNFKPLFVLTSDVNAIPWGVPPGSEKYKISELASMSVAEKEAEDRKRYGPKGLKVKCDFCSLTYARRSSLIVHRKGCSFPGGPRHVCAQGFCEDNCKGPLDGALPELPRLKETVPKKLQKSGNLVGNRKGRGGKTVPGAASGSGSRQATEATTVITSVPSND